MYSLGVYVTGIYETVHLIEIFFLTLGTSNLIEIKQIIKGAIRSPVIDR